MEKTIKVLKGFFISLALFAVSTAIFALLLKFTAMPEKGEMVYILTCLCIATLFLGVFVGNLAMKRGLLYGCLSGLMFVILVFYCINTFMNLPFNIGVNDIRFIIPIIFGSLGGMIGVNLKN